MSKFLKIKCTSTNRRQFYLEFGGKHAVIQIYSIRGFAHYHPDAKIAATFDNLGFTDGLSLNMEIDGSDLILNAPAMYAMIAAITHESGLNRVVTGEIIESYFRKTSHEQVYDWVTDVMPRLLDLPNSPIFPNEISRSEMNLRPEFWAMLRSRRADSEKLTRAIMTHYGMTSASEIDHHPDYQAALGRLHQP